jgi:predicted enzyme related to lactoylglutathione lyase
MKFYRNLFGITLEGISRTLSRVNVRKFFRSSHDRNIIND